MLRGWSASSSEASLKCIRFPVEAGCMIRKTIGLRSDEADLIDAGSKEESTVNPLPLHIDEAAVLRIVPLAFGERDVVQIEVATFRPESPDDAREIVGPNRRNRSVKTRGSIA